MIVAIVGATGSIGSKIFEHLLQRNDVSTIVTVTRRPLPSNTDRVRNVFIPDFGNLEQVSETTWSSISDADTLVWAIGTYDLNEDVNFNYPLSFQERLALHQTTKRSREGSSTNFRFILLGGAFTEIDQSRWLWFLPDQRRMKGLLQTKTVEFAEARAWTAHVIRPGGVLLSSNTYVAQVAETIFRSNLVIRSDELGAFVAELAVHGSDRNVIENREIVETGRYLITSNEEQTAQ